MRSPPLTSHLSPLFAQTIRIETRSSQLILKVKADGRLYQTWLGPRLTTEEAIDETDMPRSSSTNLLGKGYEVYPVMGTEDHYEPALEIRHADGNPTSVLKYVRHTQEDNETTIELCDSLYALHVVLHYVAYPEENVIKQWTDIWHDEPKGKSVNSKSVNSKSEEGVNISRYASGMLYFECHDYYLMQFADDWAKEMQMKETKLEYGRKMLDTRLGTRSAMITPPFFMVGMDEPVSEHHGEVLMGTIAWTGNYRMTFDVDHNNCLRVITGINPDQSRYLLKRGEVFRTPEFIWTLSQGGTSQGSRDMQQWVMRHQLYKGQDDRCTLLNNWENTYFRFDEEKLQSLFGEAKDLGVDLFLLDDGWFGNKYPRNNDRQGLGDWDVMEKKLPHGLPFTIRKCEEQGIGFGIWIEPEMVNPKSELYEKHRDWVIELPNRDTYYSRHQLVLDLSNPKVQDFVFEVVDGLMTECPTIKYMKWDCNSPMTNVYSFYEGKNQGNLFIDYTRRLYKVLDRIQQKYPDLMMMLCSSGGGRSDLGALKYFTEFWCSDDTDPIERLFIQWGFSYFMPAKAMCSHVTDWNKRASVKFRTDVCFPCKLGFDLDLQKLSDADHDYCRQAVREWNRLKPVLFSPNLYRLVSPYEASAGNGFPVASSNHCALMRVSDEKSHALVFAYDLHPRFREHITATRLQGLDPGARYHVREILCADPKKPFIDHTYTGEYLMTVGLRLLTDKDMTSRIIEIIKK